MRDGVANSGASDASYMLTSADIGSEITAEITGTKAGYTTQKKASNPPPTGQNPAPVVVAPVTGAVVAKDAPGVGVDGVKVLLQSGSCVSGGPGVWQNTSATSR